MSSTIRHMIMSAIAIVTLGLGLALASVTPSAALDRALTLEEEGLLRAISIHNSRIASMAGRFVQIDSGGGRSEGTFFIERPNKVNFRYAPPSREEIVSAGRGFFVINRQEETKVAYPQDRVPLRQFLSDEINLLAANVSDVVMTESFISVSMIDESPVGIIEVALIFDIETLELWQWSLIEPNGNELTFSLYDIVKDVEIPRSFFAVPANFSAPSN